ncbi:MULTISPECIES: hypothetical protein [Planococcus]|nr:hypothetical protein [Planococcus plakortidis]
MSRETIKLTLSILVIVVVVAIGIYLQMTDAPVYGIPRLLEQLIEK